MALTTFTLDDGNPVTVNPEALAYFQPCDDGTFMVLWSSVQLSVRESYDEVAQAFGVDEAPAGN